jgi:hypothetical protein
MLDLFTPYSGDPNEPTPPGGGDALFSRIGEASDLRGGPCDAHDRCYQSCDTAQDQCDEAFGEAMVDVCKNVSGTVVVQLPLGVDVDVERRDICERWASIYEFGVATGGRAAFLGGHSTHCDCECS